MIAFTVALTGLLAMAVTAQDVDKLKYPTLHQVEIPQVERITLDNGMRLYLLQDRSLPVFNASVRVNCGSYLEPADKVGLAGICGSVMRTGGTQKWTGDQIDEALEAVGGSVESFIGLESGGARVDILSDYTDLGLEVLSQVLRYPVFDQDKIDLAKVQTRSGISRRNDDPQQIAVREFKRVIYGPESVYARNVEYATVNAISRDDLVKFHAAYFHPQNIQIAIWGDFDRDSLLAEVNKYFGDWKKEGDPVAPLPQVDYKFGNHVYYINKPDVNQTNILLGHIGGLVTDPDYADLIVMNNILGGGFGSRLFNTVRSKEGLAYSASGVYTANIKYPGIFYSYASTKSETTVKAVKAIISEIKRMQVDAPTPDEMRMGKDGYLNSFVFNFDSRAEIVNRLMNYDFNGLPEDFLFKTKDEVEKVDPPAVLAAAQKNLRPDALNIIVVGKGSDFEMPLDQAGLGPVTNVDITIPSAEQKTELTVTPDNLKKGQELLTKAVQANGGLDNFKKVNAISSKGVLTIMAQGREFPLNFESMTVYPDKNLQVMTMMGQKMYNIRNGNTGWKTGQTGEVVAMTEDDIASSDEDMSRNTISIFRQADKPTYQPVYDGTGTLNDVSVEYLAIVNKDGDKVCRFAFDTNGKLVGKSYWGQTPSGEGNIQEVYSDFQDIKGIKIPMSTSRLLEGKPAMKVSISEYNVNPVIPDNAFNKPE